MVDTGRKSRLPRLWGSCKKYKKRWKVRSVDEQKSVGNCEGTPNSDLEKVVIGVGEVGRRNTIE